MKLLEKEIIRNLWSKGNPIERKGKTYHVGRMSYGDYFFEPYPPLGETEGFKKGTIWIPKHKLA